jgi:hypothetical protein
MCPECVPAVTQLEHEDIVLEREIIKRGEREERRERREVERRRY